MNSSSKSNKITLLTIGSTVSLSVMSLPAHAQSTGTAADLWSQEFHTANVETIPNQIKVLEATVSTEIAPEATYRPELLQSVTNTINAESQQEDDEQPPDIGDLIDLSFIEQFIDENGNVDLPLGITIYEAMGQTSIGFGGDFR